MSIDYQAIAKAGGIGKGHTRKQIKAKRDREDAAKLKAFRDACWLREETKLFGTNPALGDDYVATMALCQHCGEFVQRGADRVMTGEVHHRISRRHKAHRYNPDNGVILCNFMVNGCHENAERGLITV